MNKAELVGAMASKSGLSKVQAEKALNAFIETAGDCMEKGEKLVLTGFLTFETVKRNERQGRNPRTGAPMRIPAARTVRVKAGKQLVQRAK